MLELISAKITAIITRKVSIRELIHASSALTCPAGKSSFIRSIPAGLTGPRRFVISETYLSSVRSIKPGQRATGIKVRFHEGAQEGGRHGRHGEVATRNIDGVQRAGRRSWCRPACMCAVCAYDRHKVAGMFTSEKEMMTILLM